jgi:hypothetical protein
MFTYKNRNLNVSGLFQRLVFNRGLVWGMLILGALLAFEAFNYSTTEFALSDLLGDLRFAGVRWATILAIAFCGIDFAGIARLFTPEQGADEPKEVWYLLGAWLLAAAMNALLTWWGVSVAILNHSTLGSAVISQGTLLKAVPIFVAIMVWVIRVLIIGTFSVAGERLFSHAPAEAMRPAARPQPPARPQSTTTPLRPLTRPMSAAAPTARPAANFRPAPKAAAPADPEAAWAEPSYHEVESDRGTRRF